MVGLHTLHHRCRDLVAGYSPTDARLLALLFVAEETWLVGIVRAVAWNSFTQSHRRLNCVEKGIRKVRDMRFMRQSDSFPVDMSPVQVI